MKQKNPEKMKYDRKSRKKRFPAGLFLAVLSVVAVFGLAGCGEVEEQTTALDDEGKLQVDVILKTRSTEYWGYVEAGAKAYEKQHDQVRVTVKGASSETAYEEQKEMIRSDLSNQDYDAIVIAPLSVQDTEKEILSHWNTETRILSLDTRFGQSEGIPFIGTANRNAAEAGGRAAAGKARKLGWKNITYVLIGGVKGDGNSRKRTAGFRTGLQEEGGKSLGAVFYGNVKTEKVRAQMRRLVKEHPEGIAVVAAHNDDAAMAALEECRKRGGEAYENTVFVGFDGNGYACDAIAEKGLYKDYITVAQNPFNMGYEAVREAVNAVRGKKIPKVKDCGYEIITASNVQKRIREIKSQWD